MHPALHIQSRPRVNSSNKPTSYLYSDSFAHGDLTHPHPNHSGPWQYNAPPTYVPISELRPGAFIPITNYSGQVEPPTYDPVHPGVYQLPVERTTVQAVHLQPNSYGQHMPTRLATRHLDTGEALPVRVSPSAVFSETMNISIQQPPGPDSQVPLESQRSKQSQHPYQHHHHYPHYKGANHRG